MLKNRRYGFVELFAELELKTRPGTFPHQQPLLLRLYSFVYISIHLINQTKIKEGILLSHQKTIHGFRIPCCPAEKPTAAGNNVFPTAEAQTLRPQKTTDLKLTPCLRHLLALLLLLVMNSPLTDPHHSSYMSNQCICPRPW
jgi:hypothetical protein